MTDKKPEMKIEFAPGCFDEMEFASQEELDAFVAEVTEMFANLTEEEITDISRELTDEDIENMSEDEVDILARALSRQRPTLQ
jgi:hypothetical protein